MQAWCWSFSLSALLRQPPKLSDSRNSPKSDPPNIGSQHTQAHLCRLAVKSNGLSPVLVTSSSVCSVSPSSRTVYTACSQERTWQGFQGSKSSNAQQQVGVQGLASSIRTVYSLEDSSRQVTAAPLASAAAAAAAEAPHRHRRKHTGMQLEAVVPHMARPGPRTPLPLRFMHVLQHLCSTSPAPLQHLFSGPPPHLEAVGPHGPGVVSVGEHQGDRGVAAIVLGGGQGPVHVAGKAVQLDGAGAKLWGDREGKSTRGCMDAAVACAAHAPGQQHNSQPTAASGSGGSSGNSGSQQRQQQPGAPAAAGT